MTVMGLAIDFSGRPPAVYPPWVKGSLRYIAPRRLNGSRRDKCVTPLELEYNRQHFLDTGIVFEDKAGNALGGARQGTKDGLEAALEMQALKAPQGMAVYAAVDQDIRPFELRTVSAYLGAFFAPVMAQGYRPAVYGEASVCQQMLAEGRVQLAWQSTAWSGKGVRLEGTPGVALYQRNQQQILSATPVDINEIWADDWGQWKMAKPTATPVNVTVIKNFPEEAMKRIATPVNLDPAGRGWIDVDVAYVDVISVLCNTANPPDQGYKPLPDTAVLNINGKARLVVEGAPASGVIEVTVWCRG